MTKQRLLPISLIGSLACFFTFAGNAAAEADKLILSSSILQFQAPDSGTQPAAQILSVTSGECPMAYEAGVGYVTTAAGWLAVTQDNAGTPAAVTVNVDPHGLASGAHMGFVKVGCGSERTAFATVTLNVGDSVEPDGHVGREPLALDVSPAHSMVTRQAGQLTLASQAAASSGAKAVVAAAALTISPTDVTFPVTIGGAQQTKTISVTSSPSGQSFATGWSGGNWLSAAPDAGTTPGSVTITVDPRSFLDATYAGTYYGFVFINTQTVNVTVVVTTGGGGGGGGGGTTLTPVPTSLSFAQSIGGTAAPSKTVAVSSSGSATTFTAVSDSSWLTFTQVNGSTQTTLTVSVNATGLAAGSHTGNLTVTGGGASVTVPVTFTLSAATSTLTSSATSLTFTQALGGAAPPQQTFTVGNTAGSTSFTATSNASWLNVGASAATTPATLTVSVNSSGQIAGTLQSSITITAGSSSISVPVTFNLTSSATSSITTSPTSLSFTQTSGAAAPVSQTVVVSNTAGATSFIATSSSSWLTVVPSSAATQANLTVSVDASTLTAGNVYTGSITIMAGATSISVGVTFNVLTSGSGGTGGTSTLTATPNPLFFTQTGGAVSSPQVIRIDSSSGAVSFNAGVNGGWLRAQPAIGTTPGYVTVSVVSSALPAGSYTGSVVVNPTTGAAGISVPVTFTVLPATLTISASPLSLTFSQTLGAAAPVSQAVSVNNSSGTTSIAATSNVTWLTVSQSAATTPATLTVAVNAAGLTAGPYQGAISITAGTGVLSVPVALTVSATGTGVTAAPASLSFSQIVGGTAPAAQTALINNTAGATSFIATSNASWITVSPASGTTPANISVSVNASGLAASSYQGSVTITAGGTSIAVPVTLSLTGAGSSFTLQPAALAFSGSAGAAAPSPQTVSVASSASQSAFIATATTVDKGNWLTVAPAAGTTPGSLNVAVTPAGLAAGQYNGTIMVTPSDPTLAAQALSVSLIVLGAGTGGAPPLVQGLLNAASMQPGPVAPGEIVSILGAGLGPAVGAGPNILAAGAVSSLVGSTRVLFDGIPAPLLFVRSDQINAIVPYGIYGRLSTAFQVEVSGVRSDALSVRVTDAVPAVFTMGSTGSGPGAVVNQDGTVNSPIFPAARDSVISIYGTGEGQTSPPGQDGRIVSTDVRSPIGPVSVKIGGMPMTVQYAGSEPGAVSGMFQVNVYLPPNAPTGPQVPVVLFIGATDSQLGVTIAIK